MISPQKWLQLLPGSFLSKTMGQEAGAGGLKPTQPPLEAGRGPLNSASSGGTRRSTVGPPPEGR